MTTDLSWDWPNPFVHTLHVEESDTDRLGHTNNVRYLSWMESVAWAHIEALGLGWEVKASLGRAMAIVRTEIDYLAATRTGNTLVLGTWITDSDYKYQSSRHFQFICQESKKTVVRGKMQFACISLKSGKLSRMPEAFIQAHQRGIQALVNMPGPHSEHCDQDCRDQKSSDQENIHQKNNDQENIEQESSDEL